MAVAAAGCARDARPDTGDKGGLLAELARGSGVPRTIAPRLSIASEYRPCTLRMPAAGTIPRAVCHAPDDAALPSPEILDLAARASQAVHDRVDPEAVHTAALIDLVWSSGSSAGLERSISYLQTASRLADRPGPVLADLAAAYLVRAETHQNPRDLLEAIEAAERALEREPQNAAARFNLALALDRLGLNAAGAVAWQKFLTADANSAWASEARTDLRAAALIPPSVPSSDAPHTAWAAYAKRAPQEAQYLGWDTLLGLWGTAVLRGDSAEAAALLKRTEVLGDALQGRGSDATLAAAVRAIQASSNRPPALRSLARAHKEYQAGRAEYIDGNHDRAGERFKAILSTQPASVPLQQWSLTHYAATLIPAGHMEEANGILQRLIASVDTLRFASLAGRIRLALGTLQLREGRYTDALVLYSEAARLFNGAGEREHFGGLQGLIAETQFVLGDGGAGYKSAHQAIEALRPYPQSLWLYNVLEVIARNAADDGFVRAALPVYDESISAAARTKKPFYLAEAHLARARVLAAGIARTSPEVDIRAARTIIEKLEPGGARSWFEADLRASEARTLIDSDPSRAVAALDTAIEFFRPRNAPRFLWSLTGRADVRLALGDVDGAQADLARAIDLLDEQRNLVGRVSFQSDFLEAARQTFDRFVMLQIASGRPTLALTYLERARTSLAPIGSNTSPRGNDEIRRIPGQVVLDYALVGDTLLAWALTDSGIRFRRAAVSRSRLIGDVERARASLELRAEEKAIQPHLAALYDLLIRPWEGQLGNAGAALTIVADGEIAAIPFAALYDGRRGRYLIESHTLRFASSLHDAARPRRAQKARLARALLVADPAFDEQVYIGLARLPSAKAEVTAVSDGYSHSQVLVAHEARREPLEAGLRRADVFHFAGHAVFNDRRPERSFLLLAPSHSSERHGQLSAAEIEALDLRNVQLVVLSACQTARGGNGHMGGFAGLTGALLSAGAKGVVGSLWRVDDGLTASLMPRFHRAYQTSRDPSAALREAQLSLLRSPVPALRSPAAWAAFRYAGN